MAGEHVRWWSPSLGRDMELKVYGHSGARVIVFPTSMGRYWDWEDRGMVDALGEHLHRGWLQMYCVDSVDSESWYNKHIHPADRARRHTAYDRYLYEELLPFSVGRNGTPFVIATGASFGAYHAFAFGFRHPWSVNRVLGMSGLYDVKRFTDGYSDEGVHYGNPYDAVVHEQDGERLRALQRMDIILAIGRDDSACANNIETSRRLWDRGIGNALRIWDGWAHDWPFWVDMVRHYIGGHD